MMRPLTSSVLGRYCFEKYAGDTCGECKSGLTDFPKCTSAKYGQTDGGSLTVPDTYCLHNGLVFRVEVF